MVTLFSLLKEMSPVKFDPAATSGLAVENLLNVEELSSTVLGRIYTFYRLCMFLEGFCLS